MGQMLSPADAYREISEGRYVFWVNRPVHPSWMGSMAMNLIRAQAMLGRLFEAKINPEWKPKSEDAL